MAIQVNGTTVIDNSRNISNVGTVTATSFSGDGSSLTGIQSGANNDVFWENSDTISSSYTISSSRNALTIGPVTINSGVTITVNDNTVWVLA